MENNLNFCDEPEESFDKQQYAPNIVEQLNYDPERVLFQVRNFGKNPINEHPDLKKICYVKD